MANTMVIYSRAPFLLEVNVWWEVLLNVSPIPGKVRNICVLLKMILLSVTLVMESLKIQISYQESPDCPVQLDGLGAGRKRASAEGSAS